MRRAEAAVRKFEVLWFLYNLVAAWILFIGVASRDHATLLKVGAAHYGFYGTAFLLFLCFVPLALTRLIKDLEDFIAAMEPRQGSQSPGSGTSMNAVWQATRDLVQSLTQKMRSLRKLSWQNVPANILLNYLFAFWPFLTSNASYQIPISYCYLGIYIVLTSWARTNSLKPSQSTQGGSSVLSSSGSKKAESASNAIPSTSKAVAVAPFPNLPANKGSAQSSQVAPEGDLSPRETQEEST